VLFEHKSYPQPQMAFDMLRIWEQGYHAPHTVIAIRW